MLVALALLGIGTFADAGYRARRFRTYEFTAQSATCNANCANCPNGVCTPGANCGLQQCAPGQQCRNGKCVAPQTPANGVKSEADKLAETLMAGLKPKREPQPIQLASTEAVPQAVWNALESRAVQNSAPVRAWNAMQPTQSLRTYQDCFKSEREFVLVVGSRDTAERLLLTSKVPVAFEPVLRGLKSGEYRIFEVSGLGLRIEALNSIASSAVKSKGLTKVR